jgi:hypothetical protein
MTNMQHVSCTFLDQQTAATRVKWGTISEKTFFAFRVFSVFEIRMEDIAFRTTRFFRSVLSKSQCAFLYLLCYFQEMKSCNSLTLFST